MQQPKPPHACPDTTTGVQPSGVGKNEERPSRSWQIVRNVLVGIVGLIAALWLVLYITKGRFLRHPFERFAGSLAHRTVTVGGDFQLYFAPLQLKFYAEKVAISNPAWASRPHLFVADRVDTRVAPLSLLFGRRHFYWLKLTNGAADLEWNAAHDRNTWTFGDSKGNPIAFPRIDRAEVAGTTVRYLDPSMRLVADLGIEPIVSRSAWIGKSVAVKGTGRLRDTDFRVVAQLLSPDATVNRGQNRLVLRAWAARNVIDVAGTLPSIADVENVPLQTRARGRNMAELLAIIGVVIPQTRSYAVRSRLVKDGDVYRFTGLHGTFGDSDVAGTLTVSNADRIRLDSVLTTRRLDIVDAAPFIGYNPDIAATKGAVAAAAATGAAPQRILPDAPLPVATMQRFDAGLKWTIGVVRSKNVPISDIKLTLALDHGRLALSPLTFVMARGNVASDIVFDTRRRPAADRYDIRLAPTPLGRLLAGYGVADAGTTGTVRGRIRLQGRGDSIHDSLSTASGRIAFVLPQGSLWARNVQLSELDIGTFAYKMFQGKLKEPVAINCGLIGFTVRNGIAAADPILIDTRKNVIAGRGAFSFRSEAVDLAVRADGKKFSLFSGQSPVGLGGYFSKPTLNVISPALVERAGIGLGLAIAASPLAGVLAFVDVGDAKSAACGPVLAGATASAQRTSHGEKRDDVGHGTAAKDEKGRDNNGSKKRKFLGLF